MPGRSCFFAVALCAAWLACASSAATQPQKRPMTLVDLLNIPRVGDPQISPDGQHVTFTLATTDWRGNRRVPRLWLINVDGTGLRQLAADGAYNARWSPDGESIAYLLGGSVFVAPASR